jgi:hypothetical protein
MSFYRFHQSFNDQLEPLISSRLVPSHCRFPPLSSAPASKTEVKPTHRSNPLPGPSSLHRSTLIILPAIQSGRERTKSRTGCQDKLRLGSRQEDEASEENGRCLLRRLHFRATGDLGGLKHGEDLACLEIHELGEVPPPLSCSRIGSEPVLRLTLYECAAPPPHQSHAAHPRAAARQPVVPSVSAPLVGEQPMQLQSIRI